MNHSERKSTQLSNNRLYSAPVHFHQMVFPNIGVARWLILFTLSTWGFTKGVHRSTEDHRSGIAWERQKKMLLPYLRGLKGFNNKSEHAKNNVEIDRDILPINIFPLCPDPLNR